MLIVLGGNKIRGGYYTPFGLHHETDGRPCRAVVVNVKCKYCRV